MKGDLAVTTDGCAARVIVLAEGNSWFLPKVHSMDGAPDKCWSAGRNTGSQNRDLGHPVEGLAEGLLITIST